MQKVLEAKLSAPKFTIAPPPSGAELPEKVLPLTIMVPPAKLNMAPPKEAELLEIVSPTILTVPPRLKMPPPTFWAELPDTALLLMVSDATWPLKNPVPSLKTAPPASRAELPDKVLALTDTIPPKAL